MRQQTLAGNGFEKYRKKTRKEQFLEDMEQIIPWDELGEAIEPYYPKPEGAGRRPVGLERMLRLHFLQHWFELSDPGAEEALYDRGLDENVHFLFVNCALINLVMAKKRLLRSPQVKCA